MSITATDVKNLREKTGAGMMDCKKALHETKGDFEAAVDFLRTKGLAAAAKKQSRTAADGAIGSIVMGNNAALVEVNCETDFVAKGDDFKGFVSTIASLVASNKPANIDALKDATLDSGLKVADQINELTLKIGEKIDIRRFTHYTQEGDGTIGTYLHGAKIGVLVQLDTDKDVNNNSDFEELVKDLSMHIAASDAKFISADDIDEDYKNKEAEIYAAQLKEQGKPENMIPNIVKGKLNKLATEVCLLNQKFVKNPDITVDKLVKEVSDKVGATITVARFDKFTLGEGIEKKEDNLADEVAKMTGK